MPCPRCGFAPTEGETCARCGVVFTKLRERTAAATPTPARSNSSGGGRATRAIYGALALTLAVIAAAVGWKAGRARSPQPPPVWPGPGLEAPPPPSPGDLPPPPAVAPPAAVLPALDLQDGDAWSEADRGAALALAQRLQRPGEVLDARDLAVADDLLLRHSDDAGLRRARAAVLLRLGARDQAARRYDQAEQRFRLALPEVPAVARQALMGLFLETAAWARAEAEARELLALEGSSLAGQRGLAYALFRQDRNREAAEVLEALLAAQGDPQARELLERIRKAGGDERGMTERRLARFHVRYDGEAHEDVGREILRALERHYATLTLAFDHSIESPVPVILFSQQSYYAANGMPAWAGGHYDSTDGRIRIPIGGLTASLTPDLDGTLVHELTHAFVADVSRGQAPREIHEGLAQYLEGARVESRLPPDQRALLARGQVGGVAGFYLEALSFVEFLMRRRGQAGMNEMLAALGAGAGLDQACEQAYGADYRRTQQAWRDHVLRQ